jgi:hypothetical protein
MGMRHALGRLTRAREERMAGVKVTKFKMLTAFGRRRGWELQRLLIQRKVFWRLTGRDWCAPASSAEVALWKLAKVR